MQGIKAGAYVTAALYLDLDQNTSARIGNNSSTFKKREPLMRKLRLTGLRARLITLYFFVTVSALAYVVYEASDHRMHEAEDAKFTVLRFVRVIADQHSDLIRHSKLLLMSLADTPQVRDRSDDNACGRFLAQLLKLYPQYANLGAAGADGDHYCSVVPMAHPVNISDLPYFQRVMKEKGFVRSDVQIGRVTSKSVINLAYPLLTADGDFEGMVFAALDLASLSQALAVAKFPKGSVVHVADGKGTIVMHSHEPEKWIGKTAPENTLFRTLVKGKPEGATITTGLDGVERVYAFARLDPANTDLYVWLGVPKSRVAPHVEDQIQHNLIALSIGAVVVFIVIWFGAELLVLRHVKALTDAADLLREGRLDARTGVKHGPSDFGRLAAAFDAMAERLQTDDRALRRANRALRMISAANRELLRASTESELLAAACRVAVEVGRYRLAWVGFAEHDERKSIRVAAHHGFEQGYLEALDVTWSDTERGRGPAGTAVRTGRSAVVRCIATDPGFGPWREQAIKRGYASAIALPLRFDGEMLGAFTLCAAEPNAFDEREITLLSEMADDLAFGIVHQRLRLAQKRAQETITRLAYFDTLTGLPNRIHLREKADKAIDQAKAQGDPLALLRFDIDRFHDIQDGLGYTRADRLLKEVASRLRGVVAPDETVARVGEDEFAVWLLGADESHAITVARKLLDAVHESFGITGLLVDIQASVGIALFPPHGATADALLLRADIAAHQAKRAGTGFAVYTGATDQESPERLALISELRRAIESDRLLLHYQPKVALRSRKVSGAEALVRWPHPAKGMIPPSQFIPLAEHSGLIKPLAYWVLRQALRQVSAWREAGFNLPVSVNLSARNLRDPELVNKINALVLASGVDPGLLKLEITESTLMEDPARSRDVLRRLKDMGIEISIDDFGTGYSSLNYLATLPVDALKIDRSFIVNMATSPTHMTIVSTSISLAHALELKVVAEGADTAEQANLLRLLKCDEIQGYFYSPPLPANECKDWCEKFASRSAGSPIST